MSDRSVAIADPIDGTLPCAGPSVPPPTLEEGAVPFPILMPIQPREAVRPAPVVPLLV